jgi:integrase
VEEVGKRTKKWMGFYYVYARRNDGTEHRLRRKKVLGLKSTMKKWEAEKALQALIDRDAVGNVRPSPAYTFGWFWEQRYRPLKEPTWKASSAPKMVWFIDNYIAKPFYDTPLGEMNRFSIQSHLNGLAGKFSRSVVVNFRTYVKAILDEALEQDFIGKNPARKLEIPRTRKPSNRMLSVEEIAELLGHMTGRNRLIVRMFLVLGLRPGELFALRRNDRLTPNSLRIDESVAATGVGEPKTVASEACVWVPPSLEAELDFWMDSQDDQRPEAFIFPSEAGTPISTNNFRKRVLQKAADATAAIAKEEDQELPAAFLKGVTFQALRRSCATHMQHLGSVKDIQAHLRHARPNVTASVYMQEIPASVRAAVESLDKMLSQRAEREAV